MKTRLFVALFFICCSQVLFAQTEDDGTKPEPPKQEKPDENTSGDGTQPKQERINPPKEEAQSNPERAGAPVKEAKPDKNVKAVPVTKERKSKPAKVNGPRPNTARPAKKGKPVGRPVKPGNGRK